jgi:hypothetical protein
MTVVIELPVPLCARCGQPLGISRLALAAQHKLKRPVCRDCNYQGRAEWRTAERKRRAAETDAYAERQRAALAEHRAAKVEDKHGTKVLTPCYCGAFEYRWPVKQSKAGRFPRCGRLRCKPPGGTLTP